MSTLQTNKCLWELVVPSAVVFCCQLTCQAGTEDNFNPTGAELHNPPPEWHEPEQI